MGTLGPSILQEESVGLVIKVQVMQSLVVSKLTYNMHVLTKLSPRVLHEWEASMRMMVALLAKPFLDGIAPFQFSAGTLCGLIGVFWRLVISSMSIAFAMPSG
jgi:hypothetical protein